MSRFLFWRRVPTFFTSLSLIATQSCFPTPMIAESWQRARCFSGCSGLVPDEVPYCRDMVARRLDLRDN